eukprot:jgi/Psemu1/313825/fgenesh1_kg.1317_\
MSAGSCEVQINRNGDACMCIIQKARINCWPRIRYSYRTAVAVTEKKYRPTDRPTAFGSEVRYFALETHPSDENLKLVVGVFKANIL